MFVQELNEGDARQAIETLMDEEAEVAEDPTQNALLRPAPSAKPAPEMEPQGTGEPGPAVDTPAPAEDSDVATGEVAVPESQELMEPPVDLTETAPMEVEVPEREPVPEMEVDQSDAIRLPEEMQPVEDERSINMDAIEPEQLPPLEWGQRADPDWDDAIQDMILQSMEYHRDQSDAVPPQADDDDAGWQQALADRSNSL